MQNRPLRTIYYRTIQYLVIVILCGVGSLPLAATPPAAARLNTGGYRLVANIQCSLAWQSEYAKWTEVVNRSKGRTREKTWRMLLLTAKVYTK